MRFALRRAALAETVEVRVRIRDQGPVAEEVEGVELAHELGSRWTSMVLSL